MSTPRQTRFHFSVLSEYSEDAIRDRVLALSETELSDRKSTLINHLQRELAVQMPTITWIEAKVRESQMREGCWEFELTVPMSDPNWIAWSIEWSAPGEMKFEPDPTRKRLVVIERCCGSDVHDARGEFERSIAKFQANFEEAAKEVERFNAAVPYLIATWLEVRLRDFPEVQQNKVEVSSSNGVRRMLDKMVADGHLTRVLELDGATGKLRHRYFNPSGRSRSSGDASTD